MVAHLSHTGNPSSLTVVTQGGHPAYTRGPVVHTKASSVTHAGLTSILTLEAHSVHTRPFLLTHGAPVSSHRLPAQHPHMGQPIRFTQRASFLHRGKLSALCREINHLPCDSPSSSNGQPCHTMPIFMYNSPSPHPVACLPHVSDLCSSHNQPIVLTQGACSHTGPLAAHHPHTGSSSSSQMPPYLLHTGQLFLLLLGLFFFLPF